MKILEDEYQTIQIHDLYSHSRCLGLHSKMCATQMNTSDNPELWDIQLSSWLFCELTRQLCPCLKASSCYFKTSHTMHLRGLGGGGVGLQFSLAYNAQRTLSRLRQQTSHWRQELHAQLLSQAITHWQVHHESRSHQEPLGDSRPLLL